MMPGILGGFLVILSQTVALENPQKDEPKVDWYLSQCLTAQSADDCLSRFVDHTGSPHAYAARAMLRLENGELSQAENDMTSAISLDPRNPSYLNYRAQIRALMGLEDAAESDRKAAHQFMREGVPELQRLDEVLAKNPFNAEALLERSRVRRKRGHLYGALSDIETYVSVVGVETSEGVFISLASLRKSVGDYGGSVNALSRAIEIHGHNPESRAALLKRRVIARRLALDEEGAIEDELELRTIIDRGTKAPSQNN